MSHPTCTYCGAQLSNTRARTCKAIECQRARGRRYANERVMREKQATIAPDRTCEACGTPIPITRRADARRCSRKCVHASRPAEEYRNKAKRRRARIKGARTTELLRTADVFARDGWICQICFDPIDSSIPWPDPMSKSIDHIVPVSRGGAHSMSNVRAAHLGCNCRKGATIDAVEGAGRG